MKSHIRQKLTNLINLELHKHIGENVTVKPESIRKRFPNDKHYTFKLRWSMPYVKMLNYIGGGLFFEDDNSIRINKKAIIKSVDKQLKQRVKESLEVENNG